MPDGQAKAAGELEVALVVGRHGHDRARAVASQHIVGDPDRDLLAGGRIDGVSAGKDAGLFAYVLGDALAFGLGRRLRQVGIDGGALRPAW